MNNTALITSSEHVSSRHQAHMRSLIKLKEKDLARIVECLDWSDFIAHIGAGETQGSYAAAHRLHAGTLSLWLAQLDPDRANQLAIARKARAEACMDKALSVLDDADQELTGSVQVSIAKMKHYEKRASLADRQAWHDRPPQETGPVLTAPPAFTIQILNAPGSSSEVRIVQAGEAPAALTNDDQLDLI